MSNEETSRFRWPFPAWDADWQRWQDTFSDLVSNIDSTVFSAVDGMRLIFKSVPNAEIVSNGPGYDLVLSDNLVMQSRAHGVEISIPEGSYSLTALAVAAISTTPGAIGSQLVSWEMLEGGLEATPDVIPLGYVDTSYNITWWNGARLLAGGGAYPLFSSASGGGSGIPGGSDGQMQYNNGGLFGGAAELYYIDSTDKVGLRNSAPFFDLDIVNAAGSGSSVGVRSYHNAAQSSLMFARSRGTEAARTAVQAGDALGSVGFMGFYGSGDFDVNQGASIVAEAAENYTSGAAGADVAVYTTAIGGTVPGRTATFTAQGDLAMWDGGILLDSYNGTEAAGAIEWDGSNFRGYTGSVWVNLDTSGSDTLDTAYDQGGAGLGRAITADSGAVTITNAVADATNALELTRSGAATGSPLVITNDLDTVWTEAGSSIFLTSSGTARQNIWSDQELYIGSSAAALGVYLTNRTATGESDLNLDSYTSSSGSKAGLAITAQATTLGYSEINITALGSGGGDSFVGISATGGSSDNSVRLSASSSGAAFVLAGAGTCGVRFDDENRSGSTWTTQEYISLSDASSEWTALKAYCSGEVSVVQAINLAFAGAGGTPVTLASSATDGGLSLSVQEIGFQAATGSVNGYLTSTDWNTFNNKADADQTMYIGTTAVAINRASGALSLAGITLTTPDIGTPSAGVLTNCTFPTLNQDTTGTAVTATNLAGGSGGTIPYQSAAGTTAMLANGSVGQVLTSGGGTDAPTWSTASAGDMVLASVQSVTGLKTFDPSKLAMKGSSTGVTTIATANAGAIGYIQTLQARDGTIANLDNVTYIGTTSVALNRASAALTLAGITLTTPDIGTPSAGVLTSCTGLPVAGLADGTDGELITWGADGSAETVAAGASGQVLTSNGAGAAPTFQAGGSGGGMTWQRLAVAGPTTASADNGYMLDAGSNAVTLTLPATPSAGAVVGVQVYDATNAVTIGRNSTNIEGQAADLLLTKGEAFTLVYAEATEGWVRVAAAGGKIYSSVNNTTVTLDTFVDTNDGGVRYDYFISTGANMRCGTVRIVWDASADDAEMDDSSTADIGDTSDFVFTVDITSNMVRLRGTATGNYTAVRLIKAAI